MKDSLIFYTNPMSRGRIVRWMLEEVGATYQTQVMEYGQSMKSEDYLAINPMGKVPAIHHEGHVVTECAAICAYLADAFPEAGLAPDLKQRSDYYRWLFFAAGPLEAAITDKSLGVVIPTEKQGMVGYGQFELVVNTLAESLTSKKYIAGEKFTAADVYVGSQIGWGLQFKTLPSRPEFVNYWEHISSREAYKRGNQLDDELMPAKG